MTSPCVRTCVQGKYRFWSIFLGKPIYQHHNCVSAHTITFSLVWGASFKRGMTRVQIGEIDCQVISIGRYRLLGQSSIDLSIRSFHRLSISIAPLNVNLTSNICWHESVRLWKSFQQVNGTYGSISIDNIDYSKDFGTVLTKKRWPPLSNSIGTWQKFINRSIIDRWYQF